jgi:siroheme synthase
MRRWLLTLVMISGLTAAIAGSANAQIPKSHRLKAGQRVVFKRGTIRIGALITCRSHGLHVGAHVPKRGQSVIGTADGVSGGATIRITTRAKGSVVATCR